MSIKNPINYSSTSPAAPANSRNVRWQRGTVATDPTTPVDVSANMPEATATANGLVPTPPNDTTKFLRGDATWQTVTSGYATIDANGTPVTQRNVLNFSSEFTVADNGGATRTDVSVSSIDASKITGTVPVTNLPAVNLRLFGFTYLGSVSLTLSTFGFNAGAHNAFDTAGSGTSVAPTSGRPRGNKLQTASTASRLAGHTVNSCASGTNGIPITKATIKSIKFVMRLGQTTSMRAWFGVAVSVPTSQSDTTYQSDTPNTKFIGFRYSTAASDTKWMCVTQTDNTHQTANAESTASHVDTSIHVLEIQWNGTNVVFLIDDVQVGSQNGNLPGDDDELGLVMLIDNVATGSNQPYFEDFGFHGAMKY